jgi:hypothetical protein
MPVPEYTIENKFYTIPVSNIDREITRLEIECNLLLHKQPATTQGKYFPPS